MSSEASAVTPVRRKALRYVFLFGVVFAVGILAGARLKPAGWVVNDFAILYHDVREKTWDNTFWLGVPIQKLPLDLIVFQEIIYETKPDVIIEAGTFKGGSALFFASICDLINHCRVISLDIKHVGPLPQHKRITYVIGSSASEETARRVRELIKPGETVMVDLDSDHKKDHVLQELKIWSPFVTKGNYLIVEDTDLNGHPVRPDYGPGPMEALEEFLKENKDFAVDQTREKFLLTFNPRGYLRKTR
jgi:cephalosporin hydroxylase